MVNANLIDAMDAFLRLNGRDRKKPFGGARVVLFGDPTLERVVVDLGRGAFEHGQVYVALSRCPTLEGITLATEIWPYDVLKVSSRVREFMGAVAKSALLPGSEGWLLAGGVRK